MTERAPSMDTNGMQAEPGRRAGRLGAMALGCFLGLVGCGSDQSAQVDNPTGAPPPRPNEVELVFSYGSEKQSWLEAVTHAFHAKDLKTSDGRPIRVTLVPMGSGEAVEEALSGSRQAHVSSPASLAFVKLGNARGVVQFGKPILPQTESLVLSPVVVCMWRPMAEALGWPEKALGWRDLLDVVQKPEGWAALGHAEWGAFKLGHTHPEYSNSGLISVLAETYAATGKTRDLTLDDVRAEATGDFVRAIERAVVHYGRSTGFFAERMFRNGPAYLSAAVLYENNVIEGNQGNFQLPFPVVAIYPKEGTFWADHPVGILDRPWVTEAHREAGQILIKYLLSTEAQQRALEFGFRPALVDIPLGPPLVKENGVNPDEPKTTLEFPEAEVIEGALKLWRENKKRSHVTLVMDVSGSMRGDAIHRAKEGARELVQMLAPHDFFSLMIFNNEPVWAIKKADVGAAREEIVRKIEGLFAQGGTALYEATLKAFEEVRQHPVEGRIEGIIVLTDGEDTDSQIALADVLHAIDADRNEGQAVRIFTIRYGDKANKDVLTQMAETTRAKSFEGKPETIGAVFKDLSTFF